MADDIPGVPETGRERHRLEGGMAAQEVVPEEMFEARDVEPGSDEHRGKTGAAPTGGYAAAALAFDDVCCRQDWKQQREIDGRSGAREAEPSRCGTEDPPARQRAGPARRHVTGH